MTGSITILCGISGSGKSTWARNHSEYTILCPDEFRFALTGRDFYSAAEEAVWSCVKTAARVLAGPQKHNILIDGTAVTKSSRSQWIRLAQELSVPIHCVYINRPVEVCKERNRDRVRNVPDSVIERQSDSLEPPTEDEGFATVTTIV